MDLKNKYIVLTRSYHDNLDLIPEYQGKCRKVINFPTIQFESANAPKISLEEYTWIVFTSKQGVQFFEQQIPLNIKVAVVGPKTAIAFESKHDRKADLIPKQYNSAALAMELKNILSLNDRTLLITGNLSLKTIEHEIKVDTHSVYKNNPVQSPVEEISLISPKDLVFVFYSPSAIENTVNLLGLEFIKSAGTITNGPTTVNKLKELKIR